MYCQNVPFVCDLIHELFRNGYEEKLLLTYQLTTIQYSSSIFVFITLKIAFLTMVGIKDEGLFYFV